MSLTKKRWNGRVRGLDRTRSACWEDIFQTYTIFDGICACLEPQDLIALQRTSKQLSGLFDTLFKTQWNINRQLKRFVHDPVVLRSLMSRLDALVSGSFALQFFERVVWKDSDLDIYVEYGREDETTTMLEQHLVEAEVYTVKPPVESPPINYPRIHVKHIYKVNTYLRPNNEEPGNDLKIQVIYTHKTPLETILLGFYTRAIVNIISWDCAWSLFPDTTFIKRKTYQLVSLDSFYGNLIRKYSRRG
ncbi:hypothetical protein B0J14DRAFT_13981 [Halenospora varia]|nr:hypothetical protein B0J14DRAFT_13981 [Halenospora varia]